MTRALPAQRVVLTDCVAVCLDIARVTMSQQGMSIELRLSEAEAVRRVA